MNPENHDFDPLLKLLACKRHETPPPGFFNNFSDKVIARIEAREMYGPRSWWQWLADRFEAKPFFACAYACVMSGLLFAGFKSSEVMAGADPLPMDSAAWNMAGTGMSLAVDMEAGRVRTESRARTTAQELPSARDAAGLSMSGIALQPEMFLKSSLPGF